MRPFCTLAPVMTAAPTPPPVIPPPRLTHAQRRQQRPDLIRLAKAQRTLLFVILGDVAAYFGGIFFMAGGIGPAGEVIGGGMFLLSVVCWLAATILTVRMAVATGANIILAIIGGLLMLMPFFGLMIMSLANMRATSQLRRVGLRVGFMGVTRQEMLKLIEGACRGCGYDMHGLPGGARCPECGQADAAA